MNARTATAEYYADSTRNIYRDVDLHLHASRSVVVWSERLVLMARPVSLDAPKALIIDPIHFFDSPDAWFVHWMAGDLGALAVHIEEMRRYKWIVFQRGERCGRIHVVETEKFIKYRSLIGL